jgi:tetratricopeptide (TPR) repeat protein
MTLHRWAWGLVPLVLLGGCAGEQGRTGKGLFNAPAQASATSLAEAKRLDEVQALMNDGLFDRARAALDRLLADGSHQPQALFLKAQLTRQAGDLDGAIRWANQSIEASPTWIEPRILLAQIYLKLERWSSASGIFADIEQLAPRGPWGPYGQAVVAATRTDWATAAKFADTALERDPDHVPSLGLRAQIARIQGDSPRETALLARMAGHEPLDADLRLRLGELAQAAGKLEDAQRQFARAYELEPRPTTAQKLAALARLLGDQAAEQRWTSLSGAPAPTEGQPEAPIR